MRITSILGGVTATVLAGIATVAVAGSGGHWGYEGHEGPAHWGELSHKYAACKSGKQQSPIDIHGASKTALKDIQFHYQTSGLKIINNGHTVQVNVGKGSWASIRGQRYELLQFHFHGPSEHTVNGKPAPMEMHLVHKDANGGLGVVGVMLTEGKANSVIGKLWSNLPATIGKEHSVASVKVNAASLLPAGKSYYHYSGSLTTPPCSEGVNWNVMTGTIEVSRAQIDRFNGLFHGNARPVQPLNGRPLQVSAR